MLIKIIAIGNIKDQGLNAKINELIKWIAHYAKLEIVELRDSDIEKEGSAIIKAVGKDKGYVFALSEEGKEFTSPAFARELAKIDRKVIFIIGGPSGLAPQVKQRADMTIALSKMTFTHEMARLFLCEQIYRAINISHGGKYHNS